jgi:hypothetical protein
MRDELGGNPPALTAAIDAEATTVELTSASAAQTGSILQFGDELVVVESVSNGSYTITRGASGSQATSHSASTPVFELARKSSVFSLPRNFFGTPASGSYSQTLTIPDVRIVAAEMSVVNARGISQVTWASYAGTPDYGLRTLSGGQIVLQVDGPLAIQSNAVPALSMEAAHAVRDVCATLMEPPLGAPVEVRVTVDGGVLCSLTIDEGDSISNVVNGANLLFLAAGAKVGIDVVSVGSVLPGAGLSLSIRL